MYDPANFVHSEIIHDHFNLWTSDLSVPAGLGYKSRRRSIKMGIAPTTALGTDTKHLNRGNALTDKVIISSPDFPVFLEFGRVFRNFRKLDKQIAEEEMSAKINLENEIKNEE